MSSRTISVNAAVASDDCVTLVAAAMAQVEQIQASLPHNTAAESSLEMALTNLERCAAQTRATGLMALRSKGRLLLRHLGAGSPGRALAVSLVRDLDLLIRKKS